MKYEARPYQKVATRFILDHPVCSLWLDMGLGKTAATLTAITALQNAFYIGAVLVVAPKRVCQLTWPDEAALWDHTRHLRLSYIDGRCAPKDIIFQDKYKMVGGKRVLIPGKTVTQPANQDALRAIARPADIYLVNYENLGELLRWMSEQPKLPWDMVVWDESSKMKAHDSLRFKLMKPQLPRIKRSVLLTGTPAPRSYLDLWSQYYLLDRGERLGKFISHYRDRHFTEDYSGYDWELREGHDKIIESRIQDITLSMRAEDHLTLPPVTYNEVKVPLPEPLMKKYKVLERDMFVRLESAEIEAMNQAACTLKCSQFASGAVYDAEELDELGNPLGPRTWSHVHDEKLNALADIIDDAQGQSVMVVYNYQHDLERLRKKWPNAPWIGKSDADDIKAVRDWNAGKLRLMIVHPGSVGHGLNLQHGGHIMVWFSLTWDLEAYQQTVARLARQGQTKPVIIHHLVCPRTVDVDMLARLQTKATVQHTLKLALKKYREMAGLSQP